MSEFFRITYEDLCAGVAEALISCGVSHQAAMIEAQIMAEADLHETPSHGVRMLPALLKALAEGRVTPTPQIEIQRHLGATCVLDCGNGPGRFAAATAMQHAVERASEFGVGVCLAKNTTHWGRAHAYANRAAQAGFIGLCTTNAMPTMAIGGAKHPVIGNNPLAIGIPGPTSTEPVVLDMAMSQAAVGKVTTWLREGKRLPENWGLDADGKPSSDASAILKGAVLPMGEHKGAGLAVLFELMTAALAGAAFSHQLGGGDMSGIDPDSTKLFIALNVNAFIEPETFLRQVAALKDYLQQEARPFHYPGERGWQAQRRNLVDGVPIHSEIIDQLRAVGVTF
jgi:LDH2 family malate/lactate/ureidoglycolate dehydrogenase